MRFAQLFRGIAQERDPLRVAALRAVKNKNRRCELVMTAKVLGRSNSGKSDEPVATAKVTGRPRFRGRYGPPQFPKTDLCV
jgi:hypothetical protein